MVVRYRVRSLLIPLLLYALSACVVWFFLHHAHSGKLGLDAKRALKRQLYALNGELETTRLERSEWERRISLLQGDQIDRDLLEERARIMLGRVHKNDLVIMFAPEKTGSLPH